jgi:hypothetical protein
MDAEAELHEVISPKPHVELFEELAEAEFIQRDLESAIQKSSRNSAGELAISTKSTS